MKNLLLLFMAFELAGCASAPKQTWGVDQPQQIAAELHVSEFPATARTIDSFRKITPAMTMRDVVSFCGLPDSDIGSGLFVFKYKLSDGSVVLIGTGDLKHLIYVTHGDEQLLGNSRK
jgi:PBP1b-binding outer membrane lipoprotein LpoB